MASIRFTPQWSTDAHIAVLFQHLFLKAGDRSAVELADACEAFLTDERTPVAVLQVQPI